MSKADEILTQLLEKSVSALEAGASFLGDQIPLVMQELIIFKIVIISVFILITIIEGIVGYSIIKAGTKKAAGPKYFDPFGWYFIGGGLITFSTISFMALTYYWCMVVFAPRVYLLEYASSLIK